jgi:predicted lipoprotein with Yx(FWY)xxD motif
MRLPVNSRPLPIPKVPIAMALIALLLVAAPATAQSTKRVVKEADNTALGEKILTTTKGRTLYSLSVEKKGHFQCTGTCLSTWKPLVVPKGVNPTGPVKLGTVMRPDGRTQVTYKGLPLYSFYGDTKSGDANGEGIKDVGTWHAAKVGKLSSPPPAQEPEQPYPY